MSDEKGLLREVAERPHDDLPRRIYADWCDDHGQPERAEFIRVQLELASLGRFDARRSELTWREKKLLRAHSKEWGRAAKGFTDDFEFRGGFIEHVSMSAYKYLQRGADLHTRFPVRSVELTSLPQGKQDYSLLRRVERLTLGPGAGAGLLFYLARAGALTDLRELAVRRVRPSRQDLEALEGAALEELESLELRDCQAGFALGTRLARSRLSSLCRLELGGNGMANGVIQLVEPARLHCLHHLGLADNIVGPNQIAYLAAQPWPELESLDIDGAGLGDEDEALRALARGHFPKLRSLRLGVSRRPLRRPEYLFSEPVFHSLEELSLEGRVVLEPALLSPILASAMLPNLRAFRAPGCTDYLLDELLACPGLSNLVELSCVGNLGGSTPRAIADAGHLDKLRVLDLSHCSLTNRDFAALTNSPHLANLNVLKLSHATLSEYDILQIARSPHLNRLTRLRLIGNDVTPRALVALEERFGPDVVEV
jgi:uncharacterized protein (TIGR02996 family)